MSQGLTLNYTVVQSGSNIGDYQCQYSNGGTWNTQTQTCTTTYYLSSLCFLVQTDQDNDIVLNEYNSATNNLASDLTKLKMGCGNGTYPAQYTSTPPGGVTVLLWHVSDPYYVAYEDTNGTFTYYGIKEDYPSTVRGGYMVGIGSFLFLVSLCMCCAACCCLRTTIPVQPLHVPPMQAVSVQPVALPPVYANPTNMAVQPVPMYAVPVAYQGQPPAHTRMY
jgi:hypothetical protein